MMVVVLYMMVLLVLPVMVGGEFVDMSHPFETNVTLYFPGMKPFRLEDVHRGERNLPNGNKLW